MTYISLENIKKTFGAQTLFLDLNLGIQEHDKIGLIGLNGTGKSTLLNIISGNTDIESGKINTMRHLRVAQLMQSPVFEETYTLSEQVAHFLKPTHAQLSEYEIHSMLNHLDLPHHDLLVGELSGGQMKRLALAATLLTPCDLLILDEPTNHMDNDTIDWLESYLKRIKTALIMVTHDRYFLDRIVNCIVEIADQTLYRYDGHYETYLSQKSERLRIQQVTQSRVKNLYLRELEWIRAGVQARATKSKSRIQRFEVIASQMSSLQDQSLTISTAFTRLGKKILEIDDLVIGYETPLCEPFTYMAKPGDRIGIIGKNGSGKTTLLNTIAGQLSPLSGASVFGPTAKVGYFTQTPEINDNDDLRAIDFIKETAEYVTTSDGTRFSASELMEQFLFDSALQWTPINALSGGERRRLQLLKVLIDAPNVLLLDEPTNNLDLDTLKALERYLDVFEGIVICVSHDRYFIDRTCDQLFVFTAQNQISIQAGNYSDYRERNDDNQEKALIEDANVTKKQASTQEGRQKPKSLKKKLSFNEEKLLLSLPLEIEALEVSIEALQEKMAKNASDFAKIQSFFEEKEALEAVYFEKYEQYETLLALKESFSS